MSPTTNCQPPSGTNATGQTRAYAYNGDGVLVSATANGATTTHAQDLAGGQSQVLAGTTGGIVTDYLYGQDRLGSLSVGTWAWYGLAHFAHTFYSPQWPHWDVDTKESIAVPPGRSRPHALPSGRNRRLVIHPNGAPSP